MSRLIVKLCSRNCTRAARGVCSPAQWWFDMGGGWYDDPRMLSELKLLNRISHANMNVDGRSVAQIAFVVDDHTAAYLSTSNPYSYSALVKQINLLGHIGAPVEIVHVSDLEQLPDYRLYIFPNLIAPREEDRQHVAHKLARGGSVLWIGPAGLYREGRMADENMENQTGFSLRFAESPATWKITPSDAAKRWSWAAPASYACGGGPHIVPVASESDGQVLGHLAGTKLPALVAKQQGNKLAVYSSIPMVPVSLLRAIAVKAGVHCYSSAGDIVWATKELLAIHAGEAGPRTIHLTKPHQVRNLWSDEILAEKTDRMEVDLEKHETLLLRLE